MGFACVSRMFRDVSRVGRTIVVHDVGGGLRVYKAYRACNRVTVQTLRPQTLRVSQTHVSHMQTHTTGLIQRAASELDGQLGGARTLGQLDGGKLGHPCEYNTSPTKLLASWPGVHRLLR